MGQIQRLTRGRVKSYNSVPRIDWSHPLAAGLATYCYDAGGQIIDLVSGGQFVTGSNGTAPFGSHESQFGRGKQFPFDGWGSMPPFPVNKIAPFGGTAPYSAAMGTLFTAAVGTPQTAPDAALVNVQAASNNEDTFFGFNCWQNGASGNPHAYDIVSCVLNNNTNAVFVQPVTPGTFQSWGFVATGASAGTLYSAGAHDGTTALATTFAGDTQAQVMYATASINAGQTFGQSFKGFVFYFAMWGRALSASEFLLLHQDPYCFLIYPEEEMFTDRVGVAAAGLLSFIDSSSPVLVQPKKKLSALRGKNDFGIYTPFFAAGFEIQPVQPRHPRPERSGAIMPSESGIEAPYLFAAALTPVAGWEITPVHPRPYPRVQQRGAGASGRSDFASFNLTTWIDALPWQPPHPRPARSGAIEPRDEGIQFPLINWFNAGWQVQPIQPPHPRPERAGAVMPWETGIENVLLSTAPITVSAGWEISSFQPPFPGKQRYRATKGVSIFALFPNFYPSGWEIQAVQPRQINSNRGALLRSEDELLPATPPVIVTSAWGFEVQPPILKIYPAVKQRASGASGRSDFASFNLTPWTEIPPPQPPHPRPERAGAIMPWETGIEAPYLFTAPPTTPAAGWEITPFQPSHPHPEFRSGAIARSDSGNEFTFTNWLNLGWMIQPVQPPHPRSERAGSIMLGDSGIEAPFVFVPLPASPWQPDIDNFVRRVPNLTNRGFAILPFTYDIFPFIPFVPPPGPQPIPPGFNSQKVISVCGIQNIYPAFRNLTPVLPQILPSIVNVGDSFALLIAAGQTLNPSASYSVFITKPDGSQWFAVSPQVYISDIDSYTKQGLFPATTYTALMIPASFVDQHGYWSCYLQSMFYTSPILQFYIGPPEVLN